MNENWTIWNIKNRFLRILAAWAIFLIILPPLMICAVVFDFLRAVVHDVFYGSKKYGLRLFLMDYGDFLSDRDEWGHIWKALTSWEKK